VKKLLILISLFSVSYAFGMNSNIPEGKQEAPEGYQFEPDASADADVTASARVARISDDAAGEQTITITFANSQDDAATESRALKIKYANCSQTLNDFLTDFGGASATPIIPLNITAAEFDLLVPYQELVYQISIAPDENEKKERKAILLAQLEQITDKATLGTIITAADYLAIEPLVDCGLQAAHNQILTEVNFDDFMNEETLQNYNPYNFNHDLNKQLAKLLIEPVVVHYLKDQTALTLPKHDTTIVSAIFSPDNRSFLTDSTCIAGFSAIPCTKLWDLDGNCLQAMLSRIGLPNSSSFSPDGRTILAISKIWDLNGTCLQNISTSPDGHSSAVLSCCFNHDGSMILTTSFDHTAKLWNLEGNCLHTFTGHTGYIQSGCFSPNGSLILTTSADHTAKLWDLNGNCLHTLTGHTKSGCFSPNGSMILTTSADHTAQLWDLEGNCLHTLTGHTDSVTSGCFSPNGRLILTTSADHTAKLWDLNGNCLDTLTGHTDGVTSGCFSPDGRLILTSSFDQTAKLWDLNDNCLYTLTGHADSVTSGCFSPDGRLILTTSHDRTAKLWELNILENARQLRANCTLPQALLLLNALYKSRLQAQDEQNSTPAGAIGAVYQPAEFANSYSSVYQSFSCETLPLIAPLLNTNFHCL
jgi:WD40 repeat protein